MIYNEQNGQLQPFCPHGSTLNFLLQQIETYYPSNVPTIISEVSAH